MEHTLCIFLLSTIISPAQMQGWSQWSGGEMPSGGWNGQNNFNGGQGFNNGPPGGFEATPPEFAAAMPGGGMNTQPPPMPPGMGMGGMGQYNPMVGQGNPMQMQGNRQWPNGNPSGWSGSQNQNSQGTTTMTTVETTTIPVPTTTVMRNTFIKEHLRKPGGRKPTTAPKFAGMSGMMKMPIPMPDGKPMRKNFNMGRPFNGRMEMRQQNFRNHRNMQHKTTTVATALPTTMETTTANVKQMNRQQNMQGRPLGLAMWHPNQIQRMKQQQQRMQNMKHQKNAPKNQQMAERERPQTQNPPMKPTNAKSFTSSNQQTSFNPKMNQQRQAQQTPLVQMFTNGLNKLFSMFTTMQLTIGKLVKSMDKLVTMQ